MGEIAEAMLSGLLDEETGELIDGEAPGYPRRMSDGCHHQAHPPRTPEQREKRRQKNQRKRARRKARKAASPQDATAPGDHQ
jgi:hypothetical protein